MTLPDRIAAAIVEYGPLPVCVLATTVRKRKAEVLAALHGNPDRFALTGKARASRWSVREVANAIGKLPAFTIDELAERWKCEPEMATTIILGEEGFLEHGFMESVDGNGRVRSTGLAAGLFAGISEAQA